MEASENTLSGASSASAKYFCLYLDFFFLEWVSFFCRMLANQVYDMLGNAWEWVGGGEPTQRTLRGGSFVDYDPLIVERPSQGSSPDRDGSPERPSNHAITPATRMETTQDSGSANTSFRCASPVKNGKPAKKKAKEGRGSESGKSGKTADAEKEL